LKLKKKMALLALLFSFFLLQTHTSTQKRAQSTKEHSFLRMHALPLLIFPELKPKLRRLLMISTGGKFNCGGKIIGGEEKK
jgi:hypothetical protein